jgi:phosphatidylglycerophosphatase A
MAGGMMAELDEVPSTARSDAEGIFTHLDVADVLVPSSSLVTLSASELSSDVVDSELDSEAVEGTGDADVEVVVVDEVVGSGSVAGMVSGASLLLAEEVDVSVGLGATTVSSEGMGTLVLLFSFSAFCVPRWTEDQSAGSSRGNSK